MAAAASKSPSVLRSKSFRHSTSVIRKGDMKDKSRTSVMGFFRCQNGASAVLIVISAWLLLAAGCSREQPEPGAAPPAPIPFAADVTRRLTESKEPAGTVSNSAAVTVHVALSPDLATRAASDDTVFVFARAAQGLRIPLAIVRGRAQDLPATVRLDDTMAMAPNARISGAHSVIVGARVSKSGDANPQPGDLEGYSSPVKVGAAQPVTVTIDRVVTADEATTRARRGLAAPAGSANTPAPSSDHAGVGIGAALDIPVEVKQRWTSVKLAVTGPDGKTIQTQIRVGASIAVPASTTTLRVAAFVPSFESSGGRVTSRSNHPENPAVLVQLTERDKIVAEGWIFQKFPQFNTFRTENIQVNLTGAATSGAK